MVENVEKCKKGKRYPVLKWQNVIFHLHNKAISEDFDKFCINHPSISKSRSALAVLRKYYSTTFLKIFRESYYNPRIHGDYDLKKFVPFMFYYVTGVDGQAWKDWMQR